MRTATGIVLGVALSSVSALTANGQSILNPKGTPLRQSSSVSKTGIAECDRYVAMVTACMPKMCEEERMLVELQLGFQMELMPKLVDHKGRQREAELCAEDMREAIEKDEYGCYSGEAGAPVSSIRLDRVRPTATSVSLALTNTGPANAGAKVTIGESIAEPPAAVYRLPAWKGEYVLDTAAASPAAMPGAAGQSSPIRLEPRTTYCFVIESPTGIHEEVHRKGIFTTLGRRP